MRKILLLAAPLALTIASAGSALALRTNGASYTVSFDGQRVGTWTLRNKVEDRDTVCRYTVRWHDLSGPPITRTSLCKIDETKAGDNFDCEQARRGASRRSCRRPAAPAPASTARASRPTSTS